LALIVKKIEDRFLVYLKKFVLKEYFVVSTFRNNKRIVFWCTNLPAIVFNRLNRERERGRKNGLYYEFAVIQPKSRRRSFRRSEVNQRVVVIEVAISRANVTHERDLGKNLPFLCAQNGLILLCISHHAALWSARSFVPLTYLSFALLPREVLFLRGRCSPSRSFSFLTRRFPVSLPSFLYPFALFHLRFFSPVLYLSINLFFSLRSSGPRNEQRKSIGWHCGFVPSTVVLDLCIGTMYGACSVKLKSFLCSNIFLYRCSNTLLYL